MCGVPANSARTVHKSGRWPPHSRLIDNWSRWTVLQGVTTRKLLRGARWPCELAVEDGVITEAGSVAQRPGDEVIDCDGGIITAGLINTHHHLYQWLTRGRATSCDLFAWLQELYPVWARISVEDVASSRPPMGSSSRPPRSSNRARER